ncbi:PAAR domain-containing protein [Xanthomonas translucens]|nr:PAAR domain-containing protein [Xanthomonas translucens]
MWIVVGDPTSSGGRVVTGSPYTDIEGAPVARVGDKAVCPLHKGAFPIMMATPRSSSTASRSRWMAPGSRAAAAPPPSGNRALLWTRAAARPRNRLRQLQSRCWHRC